MRSKTVNPTDKARDIPAIKYDVCGKLTLMVDADGYVMVRRPQCYPVIRTLKEWRALSDMPLVHAAEQGTVQ